MSLKRIFAALLAAGLIFAVGCSKTDSNTLVYALDDNYPPMEMKDDKGNTTGFDVEFATELGKVMGKEVKHSSRDWTGIFTGLEAKKYDMVISAVSITDERIEKYSMSDAYIENKVVMVVKPGSGYKKPEDLKGKKVSAQFDTTAYWLADGMKESAGFEMSDRDLVIQALEELKLGRVEAVFVDIVVAQYYTSKEASLYELVWESDEPEPFGVCMRKDDSDLAKEVNAAIKTLKENGTIKTLSEKWFNKDLTAK